MRQQIIDGLVFAVSAAHRKLRTRTLNEIIEELLRMLQCLPVSLFSLAPNIKIGIESLLQRQHLDLKFFLDQQAQRALRGLRSRRIGIEVHHHILAEPPQQLGLQLGEGRPRTGNHVVKSGGIDRNAIHLPLNQNRVVKLLHPLLGHIEIEQHAALGIDRCLRRIQIFRPRLFIRRQRAPGKRNHLPRLARDRKHHAVAELGVHGSKSDLRRRTSDLSP